MEIRLRPELADLVKQDVERGAYASIDDYVEQAVSMLHEQEAWVSRESLRHSIENRCRLRFRSARRTARTGRRAPGVSQSETNTFYKSLNSEMSAVREISRIIWL
jgi:Arc/MetJ-type ribon-helix-helix transcriptional regulator